jgi:NADH:ubiquinone reductase (H+-translocating)
MTGTAPPGPELAELAHLSSPIPAAAPGLPSRPRVVVIGAGFGGLTALRRLAKVAADVTLVDKRNFHTFQPLLYQVATAGLDSASIAYPARGVLHRQKTAQFRMGEVVGIDRNAKAVRLADGDRLPYDYLIVASGAVTATFGIPGVDEYGLPLKTLTDAVRLRSHLLSTFEAADAGHADPDKAMTIVVVGGGPTGVELCGGISELITNVLALDHPRLDTAKARIVLVEMTDRLLGSFDPRSSKRALRALGRRGVEIKLGTSVSRVGADYVELKDGSRLGTHTLIWTAGIQASGLGKALGVELDKAGRVPVRSDLSLVEDSDVFVIGDLAAARDPAGNLYPQLAPVAMQQGRHAVRQIEARMFGRQSRTFHYTDKGTMATIGRNSAVAELPGHIRFGGFPAWLAWLGLHLVFLIGFRNRLTVMLDWSWNYLTHQRGARLILPMDSDDAESGTSESGGAEPGTSESGGRESGDAGAAYAGTDATVGSDPTATAAD